MTDQSPHLTLVRHFPVPPERVWAAWTDPEVVVRWFGPDAGPVHSAVIDVREARVVREIPTKLKLSLHRDAVALEHPGEDLREDHRLSKVF